MTATASQNGNKTTTTSPVAESFPVNSFRHAAPHLRRPFSAEAVKFKVQATYPKADPKGAIIVAYIDARLAVERLNLIVPHLWHDDYQAISDRMLLCKLTVDGITRSDVGEGGSSKAGFSDALKRAAVKFGVGVSLYAIPQTHLSVDRGEVQRVRGRDGESLAMLAKGEQLVRDRYRQWLAADGIEAFGQPLSHGDVEGAQGDIEADGESAPAKDLVESIQEAAPVRLSANAVAEIVKAISESNAPNEPLRRKMIDLGAPDVPAVMVREEDGAVNQAPLKKLSVDQARDLVHWLVSDGDAPAVGEVVA
jgi:hypothetical protein